MYSHHHIMPKKMIKHSAYQSLFNDLSRLYEHARTMLVHMYWEMGRRIVDAEQGGEVRAPYGAHLIEALSCDLSAKYGKGFSKSNLKNMRAFYLAHPKSQTSGLLQWSQAVVLLSVKDKTARLRLERKAIKEGLNIKALRIEVRKLRTTKTSTAHNRGIALPPALSFTRGKLCTYRVATDVVDVASGMMAIDLGFTVERVVPACEAAKVTLAEEPDYAYEAQVEKVIDGDTLRVLIVCGFNTRVHQKVRLRGIDCPEMDTSEGARAKRFVERSLKNAECIIIKTHKDRSDKYDRYLADVFYLPAGNVDGTPGESDPQNIADMGVFLNQQLLDKGLARVF